jgi:hypothetical protein
MGKGVEVRMGLIMEQFTDLPASFALSASDFYLLAINPNY